MKAAIVAVVGAVLCIAGTPVWADEPETAALKADIEVLKNRLARLESQVQASEPQGISSLGEKEALPTLELPSGLAGIQMSGYVDTSYQYSFNAPNSTASTLTTGRVFDTEANGFTPHAAELVLEKPLTDDMPIGFRTDFFFGDDAEIIHAAGLGNVSAAGENPEAFDLQQAYITARAPIGDGLDFKVGKFVTLLGAEVIESPANWNFSRSYLFGFAIPFTHTGVLASYPLGELGSTTLGVVNGWDIVDDNNMAKSMLGNITLTPIEKTMLSFTLITGAERAADNKNDRTVFDSVVTYQPLEKLTLMANYDYGHESSMTQGAPGTTGFDAAGWQGLALYAKYDLTPTWNLAGRWEWFDDKDNVRLGLSSADGVANDDIDYYEWTLTSQWKLREHVLARLEYRHDKADEAVFLRANRFTDYQDTVAGELIYHF